MSQPIDRRPWGQSGKREVTERFGENVRLLRSRIHISQETLADRAEVHRTHISMIEAGSRMVRIDTLLQLAGGLDVDTSFLLEGIVYKASPYVPSPGGFEITPIEMPRRRSTP